MARGRLEPPKLDDRNWQEIRDQAVALIDRFAPEWTDRGPSDPGITLVELFAWLVEGMIWRLDQVPERNFVEFLNLLGITRDPAVPSTTWLVFTNSTSDTPARVLAGTQAGTVESAAQPAVVFETDEAADVLPGALSEVWYTPDGTASGLRDVSTAVALAPLKGLDVEPPPNQAGAANPREAILYLGFKGRPTKDTVFSVHARIADLDGDPQALPADGFDLKVAAEYSGPAPKALAAVADQTGGLRQSGRVSWKVPADWVAVNRTAFTGEAPSNAPQPDSQLAWVRLHLVATLKAPAGTKVARVRVEHLLYNSAPATNALTFVKGPSAPADLVSDGRPFQFVELGFRPLFKRPGAGFAYDHVVVRVSDAGKTRADAVPWTVATDLPSSPLAVVRLDPVTGVIEFGDGTRGLVPPSGSSVWVESYRYVASGVPGNVAPGAVRLLQRPADNVLAVTNPGPGEGGADEEDIEQTKLRAPEALNNRDRAVTTADFEFLARGLRTASGRSDASPPP